MKETTTQYNHDVDATILLTGFAAVVTVIMTQGTFSLWDSMIGITLLTALMISSRDIPQSESMSWVSSFLMGLCALLIGGVGIDALLYVLDWGGIEIFSIPDSSCTKDSTVGCFFNHGMNVRDAAFFGLWFLFSLGFQKVGRDK